MTIRSVFQLGTVSIFSRKHSVVDVALICFSILVALMNLSAMVLGVLVKSSMGQMSLLNFRSRYICV
jgi:hypothetical protein